ncbi:3-hydroxyacyl-CoA dehydrogenase, partial [Bacillus sp. ZZQ-131]
KKWLGSKTGQGFFLKQGKEILELNPETMEYEARKKLKAASVELSKQEKGLANKLKALVYAKDRAGELLWNIITPTLLYSAKLHKEIADDIVAIDQAMKWGFGWEQGPFEVWDAIGVEKSVQKMEENGVVVPTWVKEMLEKGFTTFHKHDNGDSYYYDNGEYKRIERNKKAISLKQLKAKNGVLKKNSGASLIDLGDGILCLEFHSKSNAIGMDITQMINYAVDEVEKNYKGLVIGNQSKNFC